MVTCQIYIPISLFEGDNLFDMHYIYIYIYIYIVFTSKRLPSERNHQVADKFRKVCCLNVYGWKRGRVGVKQCMHSFHSLDCLLSVFFDDVETISDFLFRKFCLFLSFKIQSFSSKHKLHLFDPPVYEIDCFNISDETSCSGNLFEVKTILFALSIWYRALFGISLTKTLPYIYIFILAELVGVIYIYIYISSSRASGCYIYIYIYIYI